jgi:glycosyltransferase involved in cell wall biosynthesis
MKKRVLIIVENLPVPFDRRVWAESLALTEAGYKVSVICPNSRNEAPHEILDGVSIYRYPAPKEAKSAKGYIWEYQYSLIAAFVLSIKVRMREGFDVIQACNPPDILFIIGLFHKIFGGKKFIFDHHDLSPELFALRYDPKGKSLVYRLLVALERWSFRTSDVVIATNESYKAVAVQRGGKSPNDVFVVRNGPDLDRFKLMAPNPALKHGRDYLVCYLGVMANQDGLDYLVDAAAHVINERGRKDITFALIGKGDAVESLKKQAVDLGISDYVVFTGRISDEDVIAYLSSADVCVGPDPYNDFNDKCTFIKVAEYMAMGKPVVCFNLTESRHTAQEAAVYVNDNDSALFGDTILELIENPQRRARMGEFGIRRVSDSLAWCHSKQHLWEDRKSVV